MQGVTTSGGINPSICSNEYVLHNLRCGRQFVREDFRKLIAFRFFVRLLYSRLITHAIACGGGGVFVSLPNS